MSAVSDTVCPIGMHYIVDEPDGVFTPTHREYFYTVKHIYFRLQDNWTRLGGMPADQCTPPLHLDAVGIYMPFEVLLSQARIQAQDVRTVGAESCRDYHVETSWREFTVCVNESDHLPREIVSSLLKDEKGNLVKPERAAYSKWNNVTASDFPEDIPTDDNPTN